MKKRQRRLDTFKRIEGEFRAAQTAVGLLEDRLRADPSFGKGGGWRMRDAVSLKQNLEATYIVRLFAEFEAGLRDVWQNYFGEATRPRMQDLLDAFAARRRIPDDVLNGAHGVRIYRNSCVHEGEMASEPVTFATTLHFCGAFFGRLPLDW